MSSIDEQLANWQPPGNQISVDEELKTWKPKQVENIPRPIDYIKGLFPKPPITFAELNPFNSFIGQELEKAGSKVKTTAQNVIANVVSSAPPSFVDANMISPYQTGKAIMGTIGSLAAETSPFTPKEFSIALGSELLPPIAGSTAIGKIISEKLPNVIGNKILHTRNPVLEKELRNSAETAGKQLLESELQSGSRESLLDQSKTQIAFLENKIQKAIGNSNALIKRNDLINGLKELIAEIETTGIHQADAKAVRQIMNRFIENQPEMIPIGIANKIKRRLYEVIGDKNYINKTIPIIVTAQKAIANSIKNGMEEVVPELSVINPVYSQMLKFRDMLTHAVGMEGRNIINAFTGDITENALMRIGRNLSSLKEPLIITKTALKTQELAKKGFQTLSDLVKNNLLARGH